jgi:hypothetical protein
MPPVDKRSATSRQPEKVLAAHTPALSHLLEHAARLRRLDHQLRLQLAWAESARFELANVRSGTLVLTTPLAAVASRLRLEQARITEAATRVWGTPITKLVVKTVPAMAHQPPQPAHRALSSVAAQQLRAAASISPDPELRDLLLRMASLTE